MRILRGGRPDIMGRVWWGQVMKAEKVYLSLNQSSTGLTLSVLTGNGGRARGGGGSVLFRQPHGSISLHLASNLALCTWVCIGDWRNPYWPHEWPWWSLGQNSPWTLYISCLQGADFLNWNEILADTAAVDCFEDDTEPTVGMSWLTMPRSLMVVLYS